MITCKLGEFKIIVIYQYGKVGSATLGVNLCKWLGVKFAGTTFKVMPKYPKVCHIHSAEIMKDILRKYDSVLVINATRNFYHRQISEFFQQGKNRAKIKEGNVSELCSMLHENSIFRLNNWYADFEKLLGLSGGGISDFDYEKKYSLTKSKGGKLVVLVVRLEDSKQWERIFHRVVHPKIRFTENANVSKGRWYGDVYSKFKSQFRYTTDETQKLAESDTHIRFYQDLSNLGLSLPISSSDDDGDNVE